MATLIVKHTVGDYGSWRPVYDDADPLRTQHGCTAKRVLRTADDPNTLLVLHEFPSVTQAEAFANDPDLKTAMQKAGVTGPPRIEIYDEVD
ncbi:MAG: cyclase [Pseudonocardiaceae bacterium]|nr:MAG: cyclase [Pseudonocardiaceae bacterium]